MLHLAHQAHQTRSWEAKDKTKPLPEERQSWGHLCITPRFLFPCLRKQLTRFFKVLLLKNCNSQQKIFPERFFPENPTTAMVPPVRERKRSRKSYLLSVKEPDMPVFPKHLQGCCRESSWGQVVCFFPTKVANWTSVLLEAFAGQMTGYTSETQWPALQLCQASSPRGRANARVTTMTSCKQFPRCKSLIQS